MRDIDVRENGRANAFEAHEESLICAGSHVPAGRYVRADVASGRVLVLEREDWLPASFDGRVALYRRLPGELALEARAS